MRKRLESDSKMEKQLRCLLVGANLNNHPLFNENMEELKRLAQACDFEPVMNVSQNLRNINPTLYFNRGKIAEINVLLEKNDIDWVIFLHELSPSQIRNLEGELNANMMDRTSLILRIFVRRAKSKEAKLQVEMANLEFLLPRLIGSYADLGRQSGGSGTYNKGSGEKKIELDKRKIENRIVECARECEKLAQDRETQQRRRNRSHLKNVALVGYTNAGKSTLMNAILEYADKDEEKQVFQKDMLFATLDTTIRSIPLPQNKAFLLSDTVGFVNDLPHGLIKAFQTTLSEAAQADLILQVVDAHDSMMIHQSTVCNDVLKQIKADHIPKIIVFNKADLLEMPLPLIEKDKIWISAENREGIDALIKMVSERIFAQNNHCTFFIPYHQSALLTNIHALAHVIQESNDEQGIYIEVECGDEQRIRYQQYLIN